MGQVRRIDQVFIEITNACNFHCATCPCSQQERPTRHMELDVFRRVVDDIADTRIASRIALHVLGEPLLHPHLLEAVGHAKRPSRCP